jgi:hypothetical protein
LTPGLRRGHDPAMIISLSTRPIALLTARLRPMLCGTR